MVSTKPGRTFSAEPALSPRDRPSRSRGFTIMEVVMATFVMALGIATSIITMQAGLRQLDLARSTTLAAQIIQSEMENLRMLSWSALCLKTPDETFNGAAYFGSTAQLAEKFSIRRTIADNPAGEMKDITVQVTWTGINGIGHTRSFTAVYAKNGLYDYYYTVAHP